jgi:hypothetical protein
MKMVFTCKICNSEISLSLVIELKDTLIGLKQEVNMS